MFDIGFWEVALIGIVTLLVVGPDRLPEVARTAGRWVLKLRRFVAGVKSDFNRELQTGDLHKILGDQKEQINELRSIVNSTRKELESTTSDAVAAAKSQIESVEELGKASISTKPAATPAAASTAKTPTIPAQSSSSSAADNLDSQPDADQAPPTSGSDAASNNESVDAGKNS